MSAHKVYREHYCGKQHRTFAAAAKCIFRKGTVKLTGDGPYAFVHKYRVRRQFRRHVELYLALADAEEAMASSDRRAIDGKCSGTCAGHEVIIIAPLNQLLTAKPS